MRNKKSVFKVSIITFIFFLIAGCTDYRTEEYNNALQKGIDTLSLENYEKAEVYFELALENKPEDEKAISYLKQTKMYKEAKKLFEEADFKNAKRKAENVTNIKDGSESLIKKSEILLDNIKNIESVYLIFQNQIDKINSLIDSNHLDEASEKINVILNNEEIENTYFSEINKKVKDLKTIIDDKITIQTQQEVANAVFLPSTIDKERTFGDLRNSIDGSEGLYNWKLEIEEFYGEFIADITNQKIIDYLDEHYNPEKEKALKIAENINLFNDLSIPLQVLLITTIVDERATSPELMGYNLYYNFDGDDLLVNVHSGVGSGHPIYIIQSSTETITPMQGVVNMGISGYKDVPVNTYPISKAELYDLYQDSKESYDVALEKVVEQKEMTMLMYDELRSSINQ